MLGLGFNLLSDGHPTFVENLKEQGIIEQAIFSVYLSDTEFLYGSKTTPESNIMFGGYDVEKYANGTDVTYIPVSGIPGYWSVRLS